MTVTRTGRAAVRAQRRGQTPTALLGALGLLIAAGVLEVVPRVGLVSPDYLPPFSAMMRALAEEDQSGSFWRASLDTLESWALGLAIALVLGLAGGLAVGSIGWLRRLTASTVEFLRPIPSVALIPLAVLLYGTGIASTLLLVVYAAFWQVFIQVMYGVQDIDPVAAETAASYRFSLWARIRHVVWPTALPYVMTGFRLAAAVALILAVTAELVIGAPGLGKEIGVAQSGNAIALMYALVIVTGIFGILVNQLARGLERRVLSWHSSVRADIGG